MTMKDIICIIVVIAVAKWVDASVPDGGINYRAVIALSVFAAGWLVYQIIFNGLWTKKRGGSDE